MNSINSSIPGWFIPLKRYAALLAAAGVMGGLTACASQQEVSPNFGHCYRTAFSSQVINPDAPDDRTPADELTGTLAAQIYNERYVKSMLKEDDDEEESVSEQLE